MRGAAAVGVRPAPAGRTVGCRGTDADLRETTDSRPDSTRVLGQAVAACAAPPPVWLRMSTATIHADACSRPGQRAHDEATDFLERCSTTSRG